MPALPKVPFCDTEISRLILGDNPLYGYSHFNRLLSQHQTEYHTPEQVFDTVARAEDVGITGWQITFDERSSSDLRAHRDAGGGIGWFCLSTSKWLDDPSGIADAAALDPLGIAPHGGGIGDRCFRDGRLDELKDILTRIRDTGKRVGLSVHNPDLLKTSADEDWDVDYYMTGLYHLQGAAREFEEKFGHKPLSEVYLREHRDTMCDVVRQVQKPCIAFKVLAAGRAIDSVEQIRAEFKYALERIKPTDPILVGMYQKFGDQVGENAALVADICAELEAS